MYKNVILDLSNDMSIDVFAFFPSVCLLDTFLKDKIIPGTTSAFLHHGSSVITVPQYPDHSAPNMHQIELISKIQGKTG